LRWFVFDTVIPMTSLHNQSAAHLTRRHFLRNCPLGLGALALAGMTGETKAGEAPRLPPVAMAFGFAQGWSLDKKYGPLRFYLEANVELEVGFSFSSAVYGFLHVYGGIGLRIWGFGFGLSLFTHRGILHWIALGA
jgi:hypothetical protein